MSSATGVEGSRSPTLAEVIRAAMDCRELELHTSIPCRVEKNNGGKSLDVKPVLRRRFQNPDGTEINESIPVIPSVPIAWPRAGKFFITFPIKQGDLVEVIVTETSRDAFQGGSDVVETDPDDFRRFDFSDAWAYPGGGYPDAKAINNYDPDDLVIGVDGGVVIHVKESGEIALGSKEPADNLALASFVKANFDANKADQDILKALLLSHFHVGVTPGPGVTGTSAAFAGYTPSTPAEVKSGVVLSD